MKNKFQNLKDIFKLPIFRDMLIMIVLIYVGLGGILYFFQEKFIYFPTKTSFNDCPTFNGAEKVSYGSTRAYFTKRSSDKIIVYYHGNANSACDHDFLDSFFGTQEYSTLFVEYTGYGEQDNKPSKPKLLKNVDDTISFLNTKNFKKVTVMSESIGGGLASYHAYRTHIDNLVLITTYSSIADVSASIYPVYPMRLLLRNNFTPDLWLANYNGPLSVILAENDEVIPNKFGQKLYKGVPSDLKNLYIVKDAGHNNIYEKEEFFDRLRDSLK